MHKVCTRWSLNITLILALALALALALTLTSPSPSPSPSPKVGAAIILTLWGLAALIIAGELGLAIYRQFKVSSR